MLTATLIAMVAVAAIVLVRQWRNDVFSDARGDERREQRNTSRRPRQSRASGLDSLWTRFISVTRC